MFLGMLEPFKLFQPEINLNATQKRLFASYGIRLMLFMDLFSCIEFQLLYRKQQ
jgi:hypothetical protein